MGWRKVDGLLEFADRIQLQQVKQDGVDDVVWSVAPSYFRMLASENPGPFQDCVGKLIRQLLRRLALLIVNWVGMSLWTAAILAASYFLVRSDAEDKKEHVSLAVAVIFTAIAGALENLRGWCDDSKGYKDSVKCILRQLGFLSAFTNRGPIFRALLCCTTFSLLRCRT